ncbi:hypothetical protein [Legionella oakridgensis]
MRYKGNFSKGALLGLVLSFLFWVIWELLMLPQYVKF